MKKLLAIAALSTLAFTACNADAAKDKAKANTGPVTEEEKTLYAIGVYLSKQVAPFDLKPEEVTQVQKGFADGVAGNKPVVTVEEYIPKIQALQTARMQATSEKSAAEGHGVHRENGEGTGRNQDHQRHGHQAHIRGHGSHHPQPPTR